MDPNDVKEIVPRISKDTDRCHNASTEFTIFAGWTLSFFSIKYKRKKKVVSILKIHFVKTHLSSIEVDKMFSKTVQVPVVKKLSFSK